MHPTITFTAEWYATVMLLLWYATVMVIELMCQHLTIQTSTSARYSFGVM